MNKIFTLIFVAIIFPFTSFGQSLPPKLASSIDVVQIHSGHSLTDPLFNNWPGQYVNLIGYLNNVPPWTLFDTIVGKSTGPGSTMRWRWEHPMMYSPDARVDIEDWALMSITERVPLLYVGGNTQQWYLDGIDEQREYLSLFVNNAWNNGNGGNGAPSLLWTTWVHVDNSSGAFRSMLDIQGIEWEAMQDYANANRPTGAPPVYMIPGHKMMMRLYDDIQAGLVPGITNITQFFGDNIHLNSLGDYAVAMIHYACIFNTSPVGLPNDFLPNPQPGVQIPSPALAAYLQAMIWDVVTTYARTGIYTSPVIAQISAIPTSGTAPLNVSFDASATINNGGGTMTYVWAFGDGSTGTGALTSHIYTTVGTYTATLTATNSNTDSDQETIEINVVNVLPPVANIVATPTSGTAPLNVAFNGSGSTTYTSGGLTYAWNFGDGSPLAFGVTTTHTFQNPGNYTITLTVTDNVNNSDSETIVISSLTSNTGNICSYLAYDGFDYNQNTPLNGLSGGEGFTGNWSVQTENIDIPGFQTSTDGNSLTYNDLQVSGIHLSGGRSYLASGRSLNTSPSGPFSDYVTSGNQAIGAVTNGDVMWMSILVNKPQNDNDEVYVEIHSKDLAWCNLCSNTQRVGVGYYGPSSNVGGQKRWSLSINGTTYPTSVPMVAGTSALMVLKFTFNASGTQIDLFVNPTSIGDNNPGSPTLSQTTSTPFVFRSITYYGGPTFGKGLIDELRLATSYKCVSPDANITFLVPPTASISATPTTGMAPLSVGFDGTGSLNPAGGSLSYLWNFGDGTPTSSLPSPTHLYTLGGGQATVFLTVTDINNNSHSTSVTISILNENGNFPCLTSVTAVSQAQCDGTGGHLQIHTENSTTSLLTYNATPISPSSGNNYTNLMAGKYLLNVTGTNGCSEQYELVVPIDSSKCAGWLPAPCAMEIGTNLPGFADWEPHRAMRNFMKNTRGEPIPYTEACSCWSFTEEVNNNIFTQMSFDADGYPTSLPQTTTSGDILLRYFVSTEGKNTPAGQTYVLLYDGIGSLELSGTLSGISQTPGRIQFTLGGDGTFWFQLTSSLLGNHIRNIRVLRIADEFADIDTQPFYSGFLDKIAPFSNIRYMDWQHTNNNPMVTWSQRPIPTQASYGGNRGVPYEVIIQLANQTKKDIWICVPHAADNDFITQMATLFKNELDPDITIYLEYSNEVWNWIFSQANYNNDNRPFNLNYGRAMALKAKNVFDIWHNVFAGDECRVKRVLGVQAGFNYLNEQILAHLDQDDWDYGSPTHYFGLDHDASGVPRLDLLGASATVADVMQNAQNNFNNFKNSVKQDYRNIQVYGKEVITYEGGQHFVGNVFGIPYAYQQAMWDAQNSALMYNMYDLVHDSIRKWGCKLASNFSLAGPQESIYGSWGVMDDIDIQPPFMTSAPKYQALLDNIPSTECNNIHIWQGTINSAWSERCNWSQSKLPNEDATVIIPSAVPNYPQVDMNDQVKMVRLASTAILTILTGYQLTVDSN